MLVIKQATVIVNGIATISKPTSLDIRYSSYIMSVTSYTTKLYRAIGLALYTLLALATLPKMYYSITEYKCAADAAMAIVMVILVVSAITGLIVTEVSAKYGESHAMVTNKITKAISDALTDINRIRQFDSGLRAFIYGTPGNHVCITKWMNWRAFISGTNAHMQSHSTHTPTLYKLCAAWCWCAFIE